MWTIFRRSLSTSGRLLVARRMRRRRVKDEEVDLTKYTKMKVFNPGVDRRLAALKDDGVSLDDVTHVEDSEADFFHLDEAYDDYKKDEAVQKELVKMKIVGRKYFDEQTPNYLTWSEKELIRELNRTDPEEWTPQKIAESFPTTPQGATKLLRVTWKPASQSRIDRHDASAMRNWKDLKDVQVEGVTPELREHILKFTNRTIPPQDKICDNKVDISVPRKKLGEYASIVTKYQKEVKKIETKGDSKQKGNESIIPSGDSVKKRNSKLTTLEGLRHNISENANTGYANISALDQLILSSAPENQPTVTAADTTAQQQLAEDKQQVLPNKWNDSSQQQEALKVNHKDNMELAYPRRIRIPKSSLKVGATYKLKDCYYDWDGRFLYRVPGME